MRTNVRSMIRDARELLASLPRGSAVAADIDCILMSWDEGGADAVDPTELRVAIADAREELRAFRRGLMAA